MVNSNNQDPFIKRLFLIGAGILCLPFHWLYSLLFLSERLGSTDGAELSNNPFNSNRNRKDDVSSCAKNSETDENSDDVFEPVQPMNFDDPFDPINPNSINNPFNPLNPNSINSPLNPLNQTDPTSPYYQGDDPLDPMNPNSINNPLNPLNLTDPASHYYQGDDLLDPSNPLNYNNPASPFCQDDSSIELFSNSSSHDLFSGDSFGAVWGTGFDDSFSSVLGSGFDEHF